MFKISNSVTRNINKIGLQLKKYSPEILLVTGVVGVVASGIMACKATTKVADITEDAKKQIEQVHTVLADETISEETYSEEDSKKDLAIIYVQTGIKFVKLYGPAIALGALSIASILASNNIMRKRNVALAAAYTAIDTSFKVYRGRVIERFGEGLDKELKYNIRKEEVEETVTDENGNETTVKKTVDVAGPFEKSEFARFFDETCTGWERNSEYNLMFLKRQQSYANDLLKSRGYVFLNQVYEMLGIQPTTAGQIVGWYYDETDSNRDNFIDFGIYDVHDETKRAFVNGYEKSILLDFNVDGPIHTLI